MHPLLNAQLADQRHASALATSDRRARLLARHDGDTDLRTVVGTVLVRAGMRLAGPSSVDLVTAEAARRDAQVCAA